MDVKMSCMDLGLFKKIVDECSRNGCFSVRLSWRGEPLVHPEFLEMIRYVKASRIREVNFLTNALCLDERMSEGLIRAGVDWVTVSFDGIGEVYEKIRKPAIYTEAIERLKTFQAIKKRLGLEKPVLKVQSIWTAIKDNPKAYDDALSPIADKVSVIANKDYHGDGKIDHDPGYVCPTVWQRLVVTCNGDVVQCICDAYEDNVVGNAREQSIREIWHGSGMKRVRDLMVLRDRLQLKPCTKCFEGVRYVKEKVALGDRKVTVDMRTNIEHLDELGLAQQTGGGKKEERS
jgi:radical SAM protein with 4Fe4S-binding SPASM domain